VTDWSAHIDVLMGAGVLILSLIFVNIKLYSKIKKVEKLLGMKYGIN